MGNNENPTMKMVVAYFSDIFVLQKYARKYFALILVLCCRETGHFSEFIMKCAACMFKSPI